MANSTAELRQFLAGIPIFGGLEDAMLERVIARLVEERHAPGKEICREGDLGRSMYVVGEGEMIVTRRGTDGNSVRMVRLGKGEFFGEMTLIDPQPRSATVIVEKPAILYALTSMDLYALYREDMPGYVMVIQNLCRELARRLRRADDRICEMVVDCDAPDVTQIRPSPFAKKKSAQSR